MGKIKVDISVIIPTWRRVDKLRKCLDAIMQCEPGPSEICVHIDAGDDSTEDFLNSIGHEEIRWHKSTTTQGPGGGRNWLTRNARNEYLCGLDDDSWPMDADFFQRAIEVMEMKSRAAVISLREVRKGKEEFSKEMGFVQVSSFQNGACLMRRSAFTEIMGYVPLRYAYGMEEADVALQLMDKGWEIWKYDGLRVYHDSDLHHQASKEINAAHITNTGLLAYLRYPILQWPLGLLQIANRTRYALSQRRYSGIVQGLIRIPSACWKYRKYKQIVKAETIMRSRRVAKQAKMRMNQT